jgi:transposase
MNLFTREELMRKVELRMNEQQKYNIIKKLVETNGNKQTVAIRLDCSYRNVNRLVKGYKEKGKTFFLHGNRNRVPVHKLNARTRENIATLFVCDPIRRGQLHSLLGTFERT